MELRTYLSQGKPLLFDGAMGTWFAAQPGQAAEPCERACGDHPEQVRSIHRAYLEAGCQAIKTNTFSLGAACFAPGDDAAGARLIAAACRLAQEAAAPYGAFVFADLGPLPMGDAPSAGALYCRQAKVFLSQGVTCFLAETLSSDAGVRELARYLKDHCPESFLIVSFAVDAEGVTREGFAAQDLLRRVSALPDVDAVGLNCMSGPHHLLRLIRGLEPGGKPLSVMPNAGYPTVLGRRIYYQGRPDYFAGQLAQIAEAGAAIVGGCCGTTPDHIAAAAKLLAQAPSSRPVAAAPQAPAAPAPSGRNGLWEKLEHGKRVVAVELDPPADDSIGPFLQGVAVLRDAGVDAITVADCPVGRPRADSSLLACKIRRELGVEPLPHMTCRDRNLNATKALLLGLSIEDIHNVLLVTGDPIPTADRDEVKSVFNFNSRKLARYVTGLNETVLHTPFRLFGALNLNARNFDQQLNMALEKESCGISGFLTQPVLSQEALENLKRARETLRGKLLAGVFPVVSHRNACFLNNEIAGIQVCDEIVALYEGKSREEAESLAVEISVRIMEAVAPHSDGVYLMTPFQRVGLIARILQAAGL